jgi:hypothetical protein
MTATAAMLSFGCAGSRMERHPERGVSYERSDGSPGRAASVAHE